MSEEKAHAWLAAALERDPELARLPVYVLDRGGRLVWASPSFEDLVGFSASDFLGRTPPFPWTTPENRDLYREGQRILARQPDHRLEDREGELQRRDGERVAIRFRHLPLRGDDADVVMGHAFAFVPIAPSRPLASLSLRLQRLERAIAAIREIVRSVEEEEAEEPSATRGGRASLSRREEEVLGRLLDGKSTTEIAAELAISPATVRNHVGALLRKFHVRSRLALVSAARRGG